MARAWLVNGRGMARKVKNAATLISHDQIKDLAAEAHRECPQCKHLIDNNDVSLEWPGLPAGVKFDPSDVELLEHLAGKVGLENKKPHMFIDEFIPTLEVDQGICYTHPENLPGVNKDGSCVHFFHRTSNAYATGHRKRRRIQSESKMSEERVRWHKTGKSRSVIENGVHKGWKKVMVLYKSSKRGCKPGKTNWVMHQYHLGTEEDENDGELVVSKIFYQQQTKQKDTNDMEPVSEEPDLFSVRVSPRTPKTNTPQPPRAKQISLYDNEKNLQLLPGQMEQHPEVETPPSPSHTVRLKDEDEHPPWWADDSLPVYRPDTSNFDQLLLCDEVHRGFSDLDDIQLDTPPDFQLTDLQFGSQESITSWLEHIHNE